MLGNVMNAYSPQGDLVGNNFDTNHWNYPIFPILSFMSPLCMHLPFPIPCWEKRSSFILSFQSQRSIILSLANQEDNWKA